MLPPLGEDKTERRWQDGYSEGAGVVTEILESGKDERIHGSACKVQEPALDRICTEPHRITTQFDSTSSSQLE
jgi:hypothetical protein